MNEQSSSRMGKRARQRMERPGEILEAALAEFMANGFAATRVEDIAERVGVTKGTVYFYFESKDLLFVKMIEAYAPDLAADIGPLDETRPICTQLSVYLEGLYATLAAKPQTRNMFHLLLTEGRHFPNLLQSYFIQSLSPVMNYLQVLLSEGVKRGEFRQEIKDLSPEALFGPVVIANLWNVVFSETSKIDPGPFSTAWIDLFLNGITIDRSTVAFAKGDR